MKGPLIKEDKEVVILAINGINQQISRNKIKKEFYTAADRIVATNIINELKNPTNNEYQKPISNTVVTVNDDLDQIMGRNNEQTQNQIQSSIIPEKPNHYFKGIFGVSRAAPIRMMIYSSTGEEMTIVPTIFNYGVGYGDYINPYLSWEIGFFLSHRFQQFSSSVVNCYFDNSVIFLSIMQNIYNNPNMQTLFLGTYDLAIRLGGGIEYAMAPLLTRNVNGFITSTYYYDNEAGYKFIITATATYKRFLFLENVVFSGNFAYVFYPSYRLTKVIENGITYTPEQLTYTPFSHLQHVQNANLMFDIGMAIEF